MEHALDPQYGQTTEEVLQEALADRHPNHYYRNLPLLALLAAAEESDDPGIKTALDLYNASLARHVANSGVRETE